MYTSLPTVLGLTSSKILCQNLELKLSGPLGFYAHLFNSPSDLENGDANWVPIRSHTLIWSWDWAWANPMVWSREGALPLENQQAASRNKAGYWAGCHLTLPASWALLLSYPCLSVSSASFLLCGAEITFYPFKTLVHSFFSHFETPSLSKKADASEASCLREQSAAWSCACDHCPGTVWYCLIRSCSRCGREKTQNDLVHTDAMGEKLCFLLLLLPTPRPPFFPLCSQPEACSKEYGRRSRDMSLRCSRTGKKFCVYKIQY